MPCSWARLHMISEATDAPRCVWSSARPSSTMVRVYGWPWPAVLASRRRPDPVHGEETCDLEGRRRVLEDGRLDVVTRAQRDERREGLLGPVPGGDGGHAIAADVRRA